MKSLLTVLLLTTSLNVFANQFCTGKEEMTEAPVIVQVEELSGKLFYTISVVQDKEVLAARYAAKPVGDREDASIQLKKVLEFSRVDKGLPNQILIKRTLVDSRSIRAEQIYDLSFKLPGVLNNVITISGGSCIRFTAAAAPAAQ